MTVVEKTIVRDESDGEFTFVRGHTRQIKKPTDYDEDNDYWNEYQYKSHTCEKCGKGNEGDFRKLTWNEVINVITGKTKFIDTFGIEGYIDIKQQKMCKKCVSKLSRSKDFHITKNTRVYTPFQYIPPIDDKLSKADFENETISLKEYDEIQILKQELIEKDIKKNKRNQYIKESFVEVGLLLGLGFLGKLFWGWGGAIVMGIGVMITFALLGNIYKSRENN